MAQSNNVAHHLELSMEMAHCKDEHCVKKLKHLIMILGNNATGTVDGLDGNWAWSKIQDTLRNDDQCHLSKGTQCFDDRGCVKVPQLSSPSVEWGWRGEVVTEATQ
jgi:hypothetical protein